MVIGDDSLHVEKNEFLIPLLTSDVCRWIVQNMRQLIYDSMKSKARR